MNIEIKTKRDKNKLHHNGFLYVFQKLNSDGDIRFWRCEQFNTNGVNCHGRLHTTLDDIVLKTVGQHNCNNSAVNVYTQHIVTSIKRKAEETMDTPAAIRTRVLQQVPTPILANLPSKNAMKKVNSLIILFFIKLFLKGSQACSKGNRGATSNSTINPGTPNSRGLSSLQKEFRGG